MTAPLFAMNPDRIGQLGLDVNRTKLLGDAKLVKRFASDIERSHKAVTTLVEYLGQLHTTPNGVMTNAEKHTGAWKAVKQAAAVIRANEDKMRQEAKDLLAECDAEADAYWKAQLPNTATHLRVYDMAERYVAKGEVENLRALMNDPAVAAVIALSPRELVHPQFGHATREGLVNSALFKAQPAIKEKSDMAADLLDLADGHKNAWRTVMYSVTSEKMAEQNEKPQAPVMPEAVPA